MQKYFNLIKGPIILLFIFLVIGFSWKFLGFPSDKELMPVIKTYFDQYGIILVFISAIIESGFLFGIYAPGGLIIFLGVIFSVGDPVKAALVVTSVIVGFIVGYTIDFLLGKHGWYKILSKYGLNKSIEKTKERIQKYGLSTAWIAYHEPNLGSFVATAYGILGYTYKKFILITIPAVIFWCVFWGSIAYNLGEKALEILVYKAILVVVGIWIIIRIIEMKLEENKQKSKF